MAKAWKRLTVRLSPVVADKLKRLSAETGLNCNALITGAISHSVGGLRVRAVIERTERMVGPQFLRGPRIASKVGGDLIEKNPKLTLDRLRRILTKSGFRNSRGTALSIRDLHRLFKGQIAERRLLEWEGQR